MIAALGLALLLQGGSAGAPAGAPSGTPPADVLVTVTPQSPAIGEPIAVEVRVRTTAGTSVEFPEQPDSLTHLELLDPRELRDATSGVGARAVDRRVTYRLIAFDTGWAGARIPDVALRNGDDRRTVAVPRLALRVRSVLPGDTLRQEPADARGLLDVSTMEWRWWVAFAVLLGLAIATWRWWRQRVPPEPDLAMRARAAFEHARTLGLLDAGEPGRYVLTHATIVREYLAARFPALSTAQTGLEMAAAAEDVDLPVLPWRLAELFTRADAVAFAGMAVTAEEARQIAADAVRLVEDLETAWHVRVQRERAQKGKPSRVTRRLSGPPAETPTETHP